MKTLVAILLSFAILTLPLEARRRWVPPTTAVAADTQFVTSFSGGTLSEVNEPRGFKFTVGGTGITITEVGIYGNASHYSSAMTVYVRASDGTDLGNASVTWGTGTQWYWATLSSPVTLSASTTYYLMTANMGYNYINNNVTNTTTAAATINDGADGQPPTDTGVGAGHSQYAINFKYH